MPESIQEPVEVPAKLFIGRFPKSYSDQSLRLAFERFGKIKDCGVIRDIGAVESKGCGFVKFAHLSSAIRCIRETNGILVADPSIGPMQVQFATGEIERLGLSVDQVEPPPTKVFIGCLPLDFAREDLERLFSPYGHVVETHILPGKNSGFVKMKMREQAQAAIQALNGTPVFFSSASSKPLEVRLAVSKQEHRQRKLAHSSWDRMSHENSHILHTTPPMAIALPTMYAMAHSAYPPMLSAPTSPKAGPSGSNVFVFHIPPEWTEFQLSQYFSAYGFVLSSTVVRDRNTNLSKGFGFVSYDNPYSAQTAVLHMNGFIVAGKKLKVQLKRGEDIDPRIGSYPLVIGG